MSRKHPSSTFALLFTMLTCQWFSAEGREIKSPITTWKNPIKNPSYDSIRKLGSFITLSDSGKSSTVKNAPQTTSTQIPQSVTHDKSAPSLDPASKLPKRGHIADSSLVKTVDGEDYRCTKTIPGHSASVMPSKNDFRPTAPGLSPGAGHSDINNSNKDEQGQKCLNDKCMEDFQPATPGGNPVDGHSFVNNDGGNASEQGTQLEVAHNHAGQANDYRPTVPGDSPGAGHPIFKRTR